MSENTPERRGPRNIVFRPRITGDRAERLKTALAEGYRDGASIRILAEEHGLSYGQARRLLLAAGVTMRPRGAAKTRDVG